MPGSKVDALRSERNDARVADEALRIAEAGATIRRRRSPDRDDCLADALHALRIGVAETGGLDRRKHDVPRRCEYHLHQRQAAEKARGPARFADELRRRGQGGGQHRVDGALRLHRRRERRQAIGFRNGEFVRDVARAAENRDRRLRRNRAIERKAVFRQLASVGEAERGGGEECGESRNERKLLHVISPCLGQQRPFLPKQ